MISETENKFVIAKWIDCCIQVGICNTFDSCMIHEYGINKFDYNKIVIIITIMLKHYNPIWYKKKFNYDNIWQWSFKLQHDGLWWWWWWITCHSFLLPLLFFRLIVQKGPNGSYKQLGASLHFQWSRVHPYAANHMFFEFLCLVIYMHLKSCTMYDTV